MGSKKRKSNSGKGFGALLLTFSLLFTLVIPTVFAAAPTVFSAYTAYPVGATPLFVDTGDFDGDGNEDIVTTNTASSSISILYGNGNGTFAPQVTYAVSSPYGLAVGDLSGDGRDEIAVTTYNSPYNVTIFSFNSIRNLTGTISVPVGAPCYYAFITDLDLDGSADLLVSSITTSCVYILYGDGAGAFSSPVTLSGAISAHGIGVGDFNGDGHQDVAVGSYSGVSISIFYGVIERIFQPAQTKAVYSGSDVYPEFVTTGDFNHDGYADIATSIFYGNYYSVLLGSAAGLGTFTLSSMTSNCYNTVILSEDFNGDGFLDLAMQTEAGSAISIFIGNIAVNFLSGPLLPELSKGVGMASGDFNNDGKQDLAAVNETTNTVSIFLNNTGIPSISNIADTSCTQDTSTGALSFTVSDDVTSADSLTVSAVSGNTALVPNDGTHLVFGGSGSNKTLTVTPAAGKTGTATITVTVTDGDASMQSDTFLLTVTVSDASCVATDKAALAVTYGGTDTAASVTQDVTLPTEGESGTTISWSSDNTAVISNAGVVTRPGSTQGDAAVTLTATITKGLESDTKTFDLTVTALSEADTVAADVAALSVTYGGSDTAASVTQDVTLPTEGESGSSITWSSDNDGVLSNEGAVSRPGYLQGDIPVTLTATVTSGSTFDTKSFPLTVIALSEDDSTAVDKAALAIIYGGSDTASSVTQNLTLPTAGVKGSAITWSSSDTAVIANTGAVTRPANSAGDKPVTLIATIVSASSTTTKNFELTVLKEAAYDDDDDDGTDTSDTSTIIAVNGDSRAQLAALNSGTAGVSIITFNSDNLLSAVNSAQSGSIFTVQAGNYEDHVRVVLNGQDVKNLESRLAVLQVETPCGIFTLPAVRINIDSISAQLGETVELADIEVQVNISRSPGSTVTLFENAALRGGFSIAAPAADFSITCTFGGKTVEVRRFDAYVTRTVPILAGTDPSKLTTGIVLRTDGTVEHVPTRIIVDNGKYYARIHSLTNSSYAVIYNPIQFADVAAHWAKDAVNDMGSRLIIGGVGNGNFEPDRSITRAEFSAILVRALGLAPEAGDSGYLDVAATDWYSGCVKTAASYGLVTGYTEDSYGPNDTLTREQAMTMIYRAMKLTGLESSLSAAEIETTLAGYSDFRDASSYAGEGISACLRTGVATGKDGGAIAPKDTVTRAEIAVMVQRLLQKSGLI